MSISAIIMAAGLSKRMNGNKLTMKIKGKCIYEFIFETINKCKDFFEEVIVVANEDIILKKALEFGYTAIKNENSHFGQSESIKLGIRNSLNVGGFMFFTADQPFISEETIKELIRTFEKNPNNIVVPCYNGMNGSPVIFPENFKNQLLELQGDTGGRIIIRDNWNKTIIVHIYSNDEDIDIDTIEDYIKVCIQEGD
ncbi:MAG: molybdenum hydroxylase accessory protein YgfJ family [Sedimentibacter sp.]|jgi:molybdenum cofactor cytidylyltransferase|nr:molybdenum hydroxylase accessory protein YgfJ family [Sedimentibacter sp.]